MSCHTAIDMVGVGIDSEENLVFMLATTPKQLKIELNYYPVVSGLPGKPYRAPYLSRGTDWNLIDISTGSNKVITGGCPSERPMSGFVRQSIFLGIFSDHYYRGLSPGKCIDCGFHLGSCECFCVRCVGIFVSLV